MVVAAPHSPDANKGSRQKSEQEETRPWECSIEEQSAPPRHREPDEGQNEHDRAADLAEDKIVGDRESACDGISEHAEYEKAHAEDCIRRVFLKLPQGAYRRRNSIVTVRVVGAWPSCVRVPRNKTSPPPLQGRPTRWRNFCASSFLRISRAQTK